MKKILLLVTVISLLFVSCTSEVGPPGPPGAPGEDGINILGQIFEVVVDFNSNNDFSFLVDIPNEIEVFDTDVVIAYILIDVIDGVDVWEPLPQTLFFDEGILLYGFNHTFQDVLFFLDGTVYLDDLHPDLTQDQVFRVAVLPADAAQDMDLNNFESIMNSLQDQEILRVN